MWMNELDRMTPNGYLPDEMLRRKAEALPVKLLIAEDDDAVRLMRSQIVYQNHTPSS